MIESNFVYLSQERLTELEKELRDLKTNGRKDIAAKIAEARSHGDLSENAEYDAAKDEQAMFEMKINKLENLLSRVRVVDTAQFTKDKVHILSRVKVFNVKTKKEFVYEMVSPEEADFQTGKISVTSPIGQGLMGKSVGEIVKIRVPAGIIELKILSVE
ncbi:MAG: transcription elongation factor GreA [Ignavibacteriales bacterium]|jgi:transcription elongation factor GreA|nr:transcription elongation factor GreA [Ignavibacteriaceae bacterium]NLH60677.1 transcription elongation factor GreA [Ignavibacteriales bacterium]HOJ18536.1 transcription elongation factor GreA [Ignavibacteriaceae bacterium]HPO55509.1 transcription elongation factor GreA [Ignavibacteriaceae bacterium]